MESIQWQCWIRNYRHVDKYLIDEKGLGRISNSLIRRPHKMARTRGPSRRGKGCSGCTAGSVTAPRRSSRLTKTVSGDQTAHVHHGEAHEASSSPPRSSHTSPRSSQGSPQHSSSVNRDLDSPNLSQSQSAASPLPSSPPKSPVPPRQSEPFLDHP